LHYQGTTYRIDGGPGDPDLHLFLVEMSQATAATSTNINSPKFDRFAKRVLGPNASAAARQRLFNAVKVFSSGYTKFVADSTPDTPWGRSRTDAFGMIFNRVTSIDLGIPGNSEKPNAPVSYPFLWDTSWFDKVQYDGGIPNESVVERLGRNVGEVLGVFAEVKINKPLIPFAPPIMRSTAKRINLIALEDWWSQLRSPKWSDATALPAIDTSKLARGRELYRLNCLKCHALVTPGLRQNVTLVALSDIGTDEGMTTLASRRKGSTGLLKGVRKNLIPFGPRFGDVALSSAITSHVGISVILTPEISPSNPSPNGRMAGAPVVAAAARTRIAAEGEAEDPMPQTTSNDREDPERAHLMALIEARDAAPAPDATATGGELDTALRAFGARSEAERADTRQYRSRPLDGIWATGPYLHNGSVPTLKDLLTPPAQRPKTFFVGDCEIDPVNVGCVSTQAPRAFLFDTSKRGNFNTGHTAGTQLEESDRIALLEYLKSL
jgi:hypothetical protein